MAGSLNHIVKDDGTFTFDLIENGGDAHEALEECHQIIAELLECLSLVEKGSFEPFQVHGVGTSNKRAILAVVCKRLGFPMPEACPIIQRDRLGSENAYKQEA